MARCTRRSSGWQRAGLLESRWEDPDIAAADGRPRRRLYHVTGLGRSGDCRPRTRSREHPRSGPEEGLRRRERRAPDARAAGLTRGWVRLYTRGLPGRPPRRAAGRARRRISGSTCIRARPAGRRSGRIGDRDRGTAGRRDGSRPSSGEFEHRRARRHVTSSTWRWNHDGAPEEARDDGAHRRASESRRRRLRSP